MHKLCFENLEIQPTFQRMSSDEFIPFADHSSSVVLLSNVKNVLRSLSLDTQKADEAGATMKSFDEAIAEIKISRAAPLSSIEYQQAMEAVLRVRNYFTNILEMICDGKPGGASGAGSTSVAEGARAPSLLHPLSPTHPCRRCVSFHTSFTHGRYFSGRPGRGSRA